MSVGRAPDANTMGSESTTRWRHGIAAVLLFAATACSSAGDGRPEAEPGTDAPAASVARSVDTDPLGDTEAEASILSDPSVNPEGVIMAAVVLHSGGDVDAALAEGAFSRADLDVAREALADGSLDYLFE